MNNYYCNELEPRLFVVWIELVQQLLYLPLANLSTISLLCMSFSLFSTRAI